MRHIWLAVILTLIISVSGCTSFFQSEDSGVDVDGFVGGEYGLAVSFEGNNPPQRVFHGRNFNVILGLENKGEAVIPAESIRILFSNSQNFGLDDFVRTNAEPLAKRVKTEVGFIPGGLDYIGFNDLAYNSTTVLTEDSPISIAVDVCYPHRTKAVTDVCVSRTDESNICDPLGEPNVLTSAGPVKVTKIEQLQTSYSTSSNSIELDLRIYFEVVGKGDIYDINADCADLTNEYIDILTIENITIGTIEYNGKDQIEHICGMLGDNKIGLDPSSREGYITCFVSVPDIGTDYQERFTITTSYKHSQLLTKQISVMPVLETMQKCSKSDDCPSEMYCEQPGFCRHLIPENQICGTPIKYEDYSISCAGENGFCKIANANDPSSECTCVSVKGSTDAPCYDPLTEYYCEDSDSKAKSEYLIKGTTSEYFKGKLGFTLDDVCYIPDGDDDDVEVGEIVDTCRDTDDTDCYLREYICDAKDQHLTYKDVGVSGQYECIDGALVDVEGSELQISTKTCSDPDAGDAEFATRSKTIATEKVSSGTDRIEEATDQCVRIDPAGEQYDVDECFGADCYLIEYYCEGDILSAKKEPSDPSYTCKDGVLNYMQS